MRVRVTREYLYAPDGIHVRTVEVGEELEGVDAQVALDMKAGEVLAESGEESGEEPAEASSEKAPEAALEAKAVPRAPRSKGR
jgi:hypothetical protein